MNDHDVLSFFLFLKILEGWLSTLQGLSKACPLAFTHPRSSFKHLPASPSSLTSGLPSLAPSTSLCPQLWPDSASEKVFESPESAFGFIDLSLFIFDIYPFLFSAAS